MDEPHLPPAVSPHVVAGRSALPAFLPLEVWARDHTAAAQASSAQRLVAAEAEAERVRCEGEDALRQAVLDGEREAVREVERRARDAVSDVRRSIHRWIEESEQVASASLDDALQLLCGEGVHTEGVDTEGVDTEGGDAPGGDPESADLQGETPPETPPATPPEATAGGGA